MYIGVHETRAVSQLVLGPSSVGPGMVSSFDAGGLLVGAQQFVVGDGPRRRTSRPGTYFFTEEIRPIGTLFGTEEP